MKYFAKYLPVEGYVNPGDFYFQNIKSGQIGVANEDDYEDGAYVGFQKAALFLCTNEINEGDRVTFIDGDGTMGTGPVINLEFSRKHGFIMVGIISSEAIWVKAEMKFSEDDVAYSHSVEDNDDEFILLKDWDKWCKDNPYISRGYKGRPLGIHIKCPSCQTFH